MPLHGRCTDLSAFARRRAHARLGFAQRVVGHDHALHRCIGCDCTSRARAERGPAAPPVEGTITGPLLQADHTLVCLRLALGALPTSAGRTASTPKSFVTAVVT